MKRILALFTATMMIFSMCACMDNVTTSTDSGTEILAGTSSPDDVIEPEKQEDLTSEEQMQKLIDYNKALDLLQSLDSDFSRKQIDVMNQAYAILRELGDYKDVPELLSCFTECIYYTDDLFHCSVYNAEGTLMCVEDFWCTSKYDDSGRLIRIDYLSSRGSYYEAYEYDAEGQLTTMYVSGTVIEYSSGAWKQIDECLYTYAYRNFNENGQLLDEAYELTVLNADNDDATCVNSSHQYEYSYDDTGYTRTGIVQSSGESFSPTKTFTSGTLYLYIPSNVLS